MGSGLGWALREGGADVVTTLAGRSPRTARLAAEAGIAVFKIAFQRWVDGTGGSGEETLAQLIRQSLAVLKTVASG